MQESLFGDRESNGRIGSKERLSHTTAAVRQPIRTKDLWAILEAQSYLCALTGRQLTPETAAIDHRVPLARGGAHAPYNLQVIHADVNAAKHTMTHEEFVAMCREVVAWEDASNAKKVG